MTQLTYPHFLQNLTPEDVTHVMNNFLAIAAILNGNLTDDNFAPAANIDASKLNLSDSIVNADIAAAAAIVYSKLVLTNSIVDADIAAGAAIAYSKLALGASIVNADVAVAAAIAYSKLNLVGSIVNADIAAGAAMAVTKLAGGSDRQSLRSVGPVPTWAPGVPAYNISATEIDVVSTAAETTIFSKSIAGGQLGVDGLLRLTLLCDYLNSSGSARDLTLRVKFGTTTMYGDMKTAIAASAIGRRQAVLELVLANVNSASVQFVRGEFGLTSSSLASIAGIGTLDQAPIMTSFMGSAAENTATAKELAVTVQHSISNASLSFRRRHAVLEMIT